MGPTNDIAIPAHVKSEGRTSETEGRASAGPRGRKMVGSAEQGGPCGWDEVTEGTGSSICVDPAGCGGLRLCWVRWRARESFERSEVIFP